MDWDPWLCYLIDHFLKPWGYVVNGESSGAGKNGWMWACCACGTMQCLAEWTTVNWTSEG